MKTHKVIFLPDIKEVEVEEGTTILQAAEQAEGLGCIVESVDENSVKKFLIVHPNHDKCPVLSVNYGGIKGYFASVRLPADDGSVQVEPENSKKGIEFAAKKILKFVKDPSSVQRKKTSGRMNAITVVEEMRYEMDLDEYQK